MMHEIEIPPDMMLSITPGLERLVQENLITIETAQTVLQTRMVPLEIGQLLGLVAHSGINKDNLMMQSQHSQSASPLSMCVNKYPNLPNANIVNNTGAVAVTGSNVVSVSNVVMPTILMQQYQSMQYNLHSNLNSASGNNSGCPSPVYAGGYGSGYSSPNHGGGNASPMHQITRGIRGLTTSSGGGSITRGTSAAAANAVTEPLDLSMDIIQSYETESTATTPNYANIATNWYVPPGFYNMPQINLGQRLVPTPPTSPNLCIIQEENGQNSVTPVNCPQSTPTAENIDYLHSHPQICLTDVQGSEITLVALSDSSHDSDDSLENTPHTNTTALQGLVISEPSSDMPSITRGVGRKTSLENEARTMETKLETDPTDQYARRGSDKSLGFSDDSLSNDSNLSPLQEPSGSSGFKSCDDSRLSPDSLSDRRLSDEYYELPLPYDCSNMESSRILEIIKKTIDSKMPPKGFTVNNEVAATSDTLPTDASNLSIEYSSGLQVELQVTEGRSKENKGIKLRRISGDQLEYGKLCQQLITSLTVV